MTEGMDDLSAGPAPPPGSASPTGSTVDSGQVPKEKPEETEAAGASGEEGGEGAAEGGAAGDGERLGALGVVALPGTCCVCIEMEQIHSCLHSEKICILPILACLLSLALCTAGLKWVFVDKIFEYEPPTHLDPKRIGQDPFIISVDPTLGRTVSSPHSSLSPVSRTSADPGTPGRPEVLLEEVSTRGPYAPRTPLVTQSDSSVTLKYNAERTTVPKQAPPSTQEFNDIIVPTIPSTSTTSTTKTSSHVTRCSDSQRNYCVNGGECFTLEITPGSTKFLCRCPNEFTGDRCQNYVMASFYKHLGIEFMEAEELYQKRILTISGICIALLVVGIMCVVAYCKTKKQRKKLHDRLRQSLRNQRNNNTNAGTGSNSATSARARRVSNLPLQDLQLTNKCNGTTPQHSAERASEATFSPSQHEATTLTHVSSQSWSNDCSATVLSDTESVSVMSLAEKSPSATRGGRGRLNATGGPGDLSARSKMHRDTLTSDSDLFVSLVTSPVTPGSPPSEMSAPLSSLAISNPSVALSPSGEEERPLLLSRQPHKSRDEQKRSSAHYNHGHMAHSLPPSPLSPPEDVQCDATEQTPSASPEVLHTNNNISDCSSKTGGVLNGPVLRDVESRGDRVSAEEPQGEPAPFLTTERATALLLRAAASSRTNSASCHDHEQLESPRPDPVAV
ncbi:pro-neuregulin-1, membrane-bound isoform [Platichthys flesus]|uniref:pro-neuregulin-1, membrane-bound isoform n=1 Tax=Platichthys flesus TaxID=8260 RepID=UPI002DBFAAF3|nr:pro-neuregulin-1, membrane-bound isoform [Platichthys flesus]